MFTVDYLYSHCRGAGDFFVVFCVDAALLLGGLFSPKTGGGLGWASVISACLVGEL